MAVRKFDESKAHQAVQKIFLKSLRRQAREEIRSMKKAGVDIKNLAELEKNLKDTDWILSHKKNIKQAVREKAFIRLNDKTVVSYAKHKEALDLLRNWNKSVEAWNKRHAEEIKQDPSLRRYKKPFSVGSSSFESQQSAEAWYENVLKNYKSASDYYQGLWGTYVTNIMKAIKPRTPVGMDFIIDFFEKELPSVVPKQGGDYYQIEDYYVNARGDKLDALKKVAVHYGLGQKWNDMMEEHKKEVSEYLAWV